MNEKYKKQKEEVSNLKANDNKRDKRQQGESSSRERRKKKREKLKDVLDVNVLTHAVLDNQDINQPTEIKKTGRLS
jgi:hypothetical protein